jgi:hypothetical protein
MNDENTPKDSAKMGEAITPDEFSDILEEIENQPVWRSRADKEMDYYDGNQLKSELLEKQKALGIPPAVENVIQPAINALIGMEAKTRKDWRVSPDGDPQGQDVADALNYKLNQAERHSGADVACGEAFKTEAGAGIGWVEPRRESDPFKYPYKCSAVHRNEIYWDMKGKEPDTTDWRWLVRKKWMHIRIASQTFKKHKALIERIDGRWSGEWDLSMDGTTGTGLSDSWETQRSWTHDEQMWHDTSTRHVCIFEVWYRRWVEATVIKHRDGRVVEYDANNQAHNVAIATGVVKVVKAIVSRVRRAYFLGPHRLEDGPSPYKHRYFGYIPFFDGKEDATGVPYGRIKAMIFPQDSLNSAISKLRWGMSAVRTERTKGAVAMPDAVFRQQISSVSSDIVLNADHMSQPGARFEVKRDYQLNDQQARLMDDARIGIERASGISSGFMGRNGTATSGLQEQTQVEQSTQSLAGLMEAFGRGRTLVGECLISMIVEDIGREQDVVVIEGDSIRPERTVVLNVPEVDPETGVEYLSNDVQRLRLKVALEDVPTSSSFRAQQLTTLGEAVKSMPPAMQAAVMPFMVGLMDLPYKKEVVEAIKAAAAQETPEAVEQRINQAVQDALAKSGNDLKAREVAIKERKADSEIAKLVSESVESGLRAAFAAMQGAQIVAQMPQVAPVADVLLANAGWRAPNPLGQDPNIPQPAMQHAEMPGEMETGEAPDGDGMTGMHPGNMAQGDTSPLTPANPVAPASPMVGQNRGIETMRSDSM